MDSSRVTQKLRITDQTDDEMLDDREDDGRIVFDTGWDNKSLLSRDGVTIDGFLIHDRIYWTL
jgi:hypothetical protein